MSKPARFVLAVLFVGLVCLSVGLVLTPRGQPGGPTLPGPWCLGFLLTGALLTAAAAIPGVRMLAQVSWEPGGMAPYLLLLGILALLGALVVYQTVLNPN
jgi:hypothetical protein